MTAAIKLRQHSTGTRGKAGEDGWTPVFALLDNDDKRIQQIVDWTGGQGEKPVIGWFVGAHGFTENLNEATDIRGQAGTSWSAVLANVPDGECYVQQVVDWIGTGVTKPETGLYLSATGFVSDISLATNIRGEKGEKGIDGAKGDKGDKGDKGNDIIPTGSVFMFVGLDAPEGFLKANGTVLLREDFPDLWAHAQSSGALVTETQWNANSWGCFSDGDGSTTFRIPELRGAFIRGFDDGRGFDAGRTLGSWQDDAFKQHQHTGTTAGSGSHKHSVWTGAAGAHQHDSGDRFTYGSGSTIAAGTGYNMTDQLRKTSWADTHTHTADMSVTPNHTHSFTTDIVGEIETRPANLALMFCIKY